MNQTKPISKKTIRNLIREITKQDFNKQELIKLLLESFDADGCVIADNNKKITISSDTILDNITGTVVYDNSLQSGAITIIENAGKDERFKNNIKQSTVNNLSVVFIPIKMNKEVIGILYLERSSQDKSIFKIKEAENFRKLFTPVFIYLLHNRNLSAGSRSNFFGLIGKSPVMKEVFRQITLFAQFDEPVLIQGESGTGKELIANAIHEFSFRRENIFVPINCAGISEGLAESFFFGHKKGAFTDAKEDLIGKFELADKGTLFLDEIGDLSLASQAKLLRVLEDKKVSKVGENTEFKSDFRLLAATNKDLEKMMEEGSFREDLYYRISALGIIVPPLKKRLEDIPAIAQKKINEMCRQYDLNIESPRLTDGAIEKLKKHIWKGNIRELINTIERSVALHNSDDPLKENDIIIITKPGESAKKKITIPSPIYGDDLEDIIFHITKMLFKKNNRHLGDTASELGITRHSLNNILTKTGVFKSNVIKQKQKK